jgi:hypothetical protein
VARRDFHLAVRPAGESADQGIFGQTLPLPEMPCYPSHAVPSASNGQARRTRRPVTTIQVPDRNRFDRAAFAPGS